MPSLLACSAGGDRIAFLLGIVDYMASVKGYKEYGRWEKVCGISAGSMFAAYISNTTPDSFEKDLKHLKHIFFTKPMNAISPWVGGGHFFNMLDSLIYHPSFFSNKVLRKGILDYFNPTNIKRTLEVGCFNKTDSSYRTFNSDVSLKEMGDAVLASASVPLVFPPVQIHDKQYQDGCMRHLIPVEEIKRFIQIEEGPKNIDVLVCYPINNRKLFMEMVKDRFSSPLLSEAMDAIVNIMVEQMENDLVELAHIMNTTVGTIKQASSQTLKHGEITMTILSPYIGHYTSFTKQSTFKNKELYNAGVQVAKHFLAPPLKL
jgi:predicted acylesterase/phospholipase RssA